MEAGNLITFDNGVSGSVSSDSVTIDVSDASMSFLGTAGTAGSLTAIMGTAFVQSATGVQNVSAGAADLSPEAAVTAVTFTLEGAPLAAGIAFDETAGGSGIWIDVDGGGCDTKDIFSDTYTGNTVTFSAVAFTAGGFPGGTFSPTFCMEVDGATTISNGTVTVSTSAEANTLSGGAAQLNINLTDATLATFARNGDTETSFVVTRPTAGDQTFVRVTNLTNLPGQLFVTLYDQATGDVLGTSGATLQASLAGNATAVFTSQQIADAIGVTDWTGRARAEISSEITDIAVVSTFAMQAVR